MNKEIKYRCWDGKTILYSDQHFDTLSTFFGYYHEHFYFDANGPQDVVLMQYTGLKDKNGKEIYEGDVLCYILGEGEIDFQPVKFMDGMFVIGTNDMEPLVSELGYWKDAIYIEGNIYENPDLKTIG